MNGLESQEACAYSETTEMFITDSSDGLWAYVGPDGAVFIFEPEWEEIRENTNIVDQDDGNWEEIDEFVPLETNLPIWYQRMMAGSGDINNLFSRWADHE